MAKLDFEYLYEVITKYYPLGIRDTDPAYIEYPGLISMQELANQKIEPVPYNRWKECVKGFKPSEHAILQTSAESPLFHPCYSGRIRLTKEKTGRFTYTRELFVHLSVLGPFYSIYGADKVSLDIDGEEETFDPVIFASPYLFYRKIFLELRDRIQHNYPDHIFVPQMLLAKRLSSVYVSGMKRRSEKNASVFQALFIPDDITEFPIKGDRHYD